MKGNNTKLFFDSLRFFIKICGFLLTAFIPLVLGALAVLKIGDVRTFQGSPVEFFFYFFVAIVCGVIIWRKRFRGNFL